MDIDLRPNSLATNRRQMLSFIVRELERIEEGVVFPLKAECERLNTTLEGFVSGGAY